MSYSSESNELLGGPTADERQWAVLAHIGGLLGMALSASSLGFLVPLVIWLMKKGQAPFTVDQAKEALNFQISILLTAIGLAIIGLILTVVTLGAALLVVIPAGIALGAYGIVMPIIAAIKVNEGEAYRYPWTLRLIA